MVIIVVTATGAIFFIKGTTTASSDERTAIVLNAAERAYVLKEMRGLLEAIEAITLGISQDDMKAVSLASREVGMGATRSGNEPMTLIVKLPLGFKTLGMSVHRSFDELALEADTMGDGSIILGKLGAILNTCITCHASYKFVDYPPTQFTILGRYGALKALHKLGVGGGTQPLLPHSILS